MALHPQCPRPWCPWAADNGTGMSPIGLPSCPVHDTGSGVHSRHCLLASLPSPMPSKHSAVVRPHLAEWELGRGRPPTLAPSLLSQPLSQGTHGPQGPSPSSRFGGVLYPPGSPGALALPTLACKLLVLPCPIPLCALHLVQPGLHLQALLAPELLLPASVSASISSASPLCVPHRHRWPYWGAGHKLDAPG